MSFYRTYRPQVLNEIDNAVVREHIASFLRKNRSDLPHAFLFHGPKGTGKTTAARIVAKLFNCQKLSKRDGPCGACSQCKSIAVGGNIDVLEMDAASSRGIDDIRALRDQIALSPASASYKVYIIDEVHMLTAEAFNALLKTLEEPPRHAVFILATTDSHKVPATIVSRTIAIPFRKAGNEELIHALSRIVRKEKIDIDKEALLRIVRAADGSFRDAAKMLEQVSLHRGKITSEVVGNKLSLSAQSLREKLFESLVARDAAAGLGIVTSLVADGDDIKSFLTDSLHDLSDMLIANISGKGTVKGWDGASIRQAIHLFSEAYVLLRNSPIPQLPLELAIVEFCEEKATREDGEKYKESQRDTSAESKITVKEKEVNQEASSASMGLLTLEKLAGHWPDFIASLKSYNHSVAGVLRSSRPKAVKDGIVTIEAFYKFHAEKLAEPKTREVLAQTLKKLFGDKVKVDVVLGEK